MLHKDKLQEDTQQYYTRKQVAELLGISESTVYRYANEGQIRTVPNPYSMRNQTIYYSEEVDALAKDRAELNALNEDLTIPQLAKRLGTSRQHIDHFIKTNQLQVKRIQVGNRIRIALPLETIERVTHLYQESLNNSAKYKKHLYYNEKYQIVLFQAFQSLDGRLFRVGVQEDEWGLYDDKNGIFIRYEDAITQSSIQAKPLYSIQSQRTSREANYLLLSLPKNVEVSWAIFDYFLAAVGIDSISIRQLEHHIELSVKQGIISLSNYPFPNEMTVEKINLYLREGELAINDCELFLIGRYQKTSFMVQRNFLQALQHEAEQANMSASDLLNQILDERYNKR